MRRFYTTADIAPTAGGHAVRLDGKPLNTSARRPLVVPTVALARTVAAEWAAQGEIVAPASMPVNRLAMTAVDLSDAQRGGAVDQVVDYVQTDLLCYRATYPPELVDAQARHWDPPLAWFAATRGVRLAVARGLVPVAQPEEAGRGVAAELRGLSNWRLVGVHALATTSGSAVLALMVAAGALAAAAAGDAALVDERFERARWGEEADALERERRLLADLDAAERYLATLSG